MTTTEPRRETLLRIPEFIERLKNIPRAERRRIWSVCAAELRHLKHGQYFPKKHNGTEQRGYSRTTLRKAVTTYRNAISGTTELGPNHPALTYLRVSLVDQEAVATAQLSRVYKQHQRLRPLQEDPLLALARGLIAQPQRQPALLVAAALLLITGRRPVELMLMGEFKPSTRAHHLLFSGQAKTRGSEDAQIAPYEIPVLDAPSRVLRAISWLRGVYPLHGLTPHDAHKRYNVMLNRYTQQHFRDANSTPLKPSELRAAYATIAYFTYAPRTSSLPLYFAQILGHSEGDLVTSHSYFRFYLTSPERRGSAGLAQMLRRINTGTRDVIAGLQDELAALDDPNERELLATRIMQFAESLRK